LAIGVFSGLQTGSFAEASPARSALTGNDSQHVAMIEEGLRGRLRTEKINSGLEAYDDTPLDSRTPLILVHGIASYASDSFHWGSFLNYAAKKPDFQTKYKVYLYHYDSSCSVPAISKDLQKNLKEFIGGLNGRNIKILAYSEGGLLTRNALQDPYLDAHTLEVLAIATPFHGSPLANPAWIQQQVKTENAFSLVRMGQKIGYKITRHKFPTFKEDFRWDNFDGAIPMADYIKANGPLTKTDYTLAKKTQFVTYGSYFGMGVDSAVMQKALGLKNPTPREKLSMGNLFRVKHLMFSLIRNNIGRLPLAGALTHPAEKNIASNNNAQLVETPLNTAITLNAVAGDAPPHKAAERLSKALSKDSKPAVSEAVSMMMFNDGISPISSTLWLGRYTQGANGSTISVDNLWSALKSLKGGRQARLFSGLDHRNWMDGTTRTGQPLIQDLLNPDEPPRTVFEWIVYDLMS